MDNQALKEWFKKLYEALHIFRKAKNDNGQSFVNELNKIDKSLIAGYIDIYISGKMEKVKKIRLDILEYLKKWSITLDIIEKLKKQENDKYDYDILKTWPNFSILYMLYCAFNKQPNEFLEKLNEDLVNDLWLNDKVKIKKNVFDAGMNFWKDDFWTAIYNNSYHSQKTALQLFICSSISGKQLDNTVAIWLWGWPDRVEKDQYKLEEFEINNIKYENILEKLKKYKNLILQDMDKEDNNGDTNQKYRLYAPWEKAKKREEFYDKGIIGIWWDKLGDINEYKKRDDLKQYYIEVYWKEQNNNILACYQFTHEMKIGDVIIVKKGTKKFIGYWIVASDYIYDDSREEYKSIRKVNRIQKGEWDVGNGSHIVVKTLTEISVKYPEYVEELKQLLWILPQSPTPMNISKPINDLNTILYGAPWTGKTYNTINYALSIIENKTLDEINTEGRTELKKKFDRYKEQGQIVFCTFHQSLSYEEFIEWIRASSENGNISYDVGNGIFKNIALKANEKSISKSFETAYERFINDVIEKESILEIKTLSQGKPFNVKINSKWNCIVTPKTEVATEMTVTKDMIKDFIENGIIRDWKPYTTAIADYILKNYKQENNIEDNSKKNYVLIIDEINRGNMSKIFGELITLLEPSKRIWAEEELKVILPYSQDEFGVPQNLYVIWTMNTADRSIALIDIALRRRFTFKETEPNSNLLDFKVWNIDIKRMFETINQRIEFLYDRDHRLWHSFFMTLRENNSLEKLNEIFYNNIIPLLQEYFYEDWEKIQIVLWDHKNQKTKWKDDKLIQEETQSELNTIGFNHEDMEDKAKYIVNKLPNEKSYLWIYSKTIDEETK